MEKLKSVILIGIILFFMIFILTGCTLTVETTNNSVTASVDGNTTEQVDSVLDWIKERVERVFNSDSKNNNSISTNI